MTAMAQIRRIPGPRPLPLHLAISNSVWLSSQAALPTLNNGSLPWRADCREAGTSLSRALENVNPEDFAVAVEAEARRRLGAFAEGIARYNAFPRPDGCVHGRPADAPEVWRQGTTCVYDYGGVDPAAAAGAPVLVVPSLINRANILDLLPERSLLRAMASAGLRPFLVDWDSPGESENAFSLTDYIAGRLAGALDAVANMSGGPVAVVGYCMGGNLALPLPLFAPDKVSALALLATPWDFAAMEAAPVRLLEANRPRFEAVIDAYGGLPVDVLQAMFSSLDPFLAVNKFTRFAGLDPESDEARHFVALEDWLNDGVRLTAPVARECLFDWYRRNTPGRGLWRVAGDPVLPARIACPALVVVPELDTIVPPASARPLGDALQNAETVRQRAGHIGMVAGGNGPRRLYPLLIDWLLSRRA